MIRVHVNVMLDLKMGFQHPETEAIRIVRDAVKNGTYHYVRGFSVKKKLLATIIEPDGSERVEEIEWTLEALTGLMKGGFRMVPLREREYVIEADNWHATPTSVNHVATAKLGRILHGRVLIVPKTSS